MQVQSILLLQQLYHDPTQTRLVPVHYLPPSLHFPFAIPTAWIEEDLNEEGIQHQSKMCTKKR